MKKGKIINLKNDDAGSEKEIQYANTIKKCISEIYLNSLREIEELINKKKE